MPLHNPGATLVLFNHDFDAIAHARLQADWPLVSAGFNLFAFPSQLRLGWLDLERMAALQAVRARAQGLKAVLSHHEQFGALTAALVAERLGWPGTPVRAVLACQHKLHARRVLQSVCPEASIPCARWEGEGLQGSSVRRLSRHRATESAQPALPYPFFIKPVKAAFSVFAREVAAPADLRPLGTLGMWDSILLNLLSRPFDRVVAHRLPEAGSARGLMIEQPVHAPQFNLDGYVFEGEVRHLGVVDAVMYPGTQAFMRFDYPSRLAPAVVHRAVDVARRFLQAIGFTHGPFNMEFFYDEAEDRLSVIEFNPRLASQFSDLYERVDGLNLHELALALAHGQDPALLPRREPRSKVASSFVYRSFDGRRPVHRPTPQQVGVLQAAYPDALFLPYAKSDTAIRRDLQWLGSCRHGILHLGGQDAADLQRRCEVASRLLGWTPPYAEWHAARTEARHGASTAHGTPAMPHGSITT